MSTNSKNIPVDDRDWTKLTFGEQVKMLEVDGYVVLPNVLNESQIQTLKDEIAKVETKGADYSEKEREIAILTTAREHDAQFEWCAHEREGRRVGVPEETIDIIRYRRPTDGLPEPHAVLIEMGRQLFQTHALDSDTFTRARAAFELGTMIDIIALMGAYSSTAILLAAFDVQLPEGEDPGLPVDH